MSGSGAGTEAERTGFVRRLIAETAFGAVPRDSADDGGIPRRLVRFWDDPSGPPSDVAACMASWETLTDEGFEIETHDDGTAARFVSETYGPREIEAFARCRHPAMRCDYFRLCRLLAVGGLYVDCDDVLLGEGWRGLFGDAMLKLQPLGYDLNLGRMMSPDELWAPGLDAAGRVLYVNNDPLASPPGHPVLRRCLEMATERLLDDDREAEIQSTTGPGVLTEALVRHGIDREQRGLPRDFALIRDWDAIAEMRWDLSYRGDDRNWRNVYGC